MYEIFGRAPAEGPLSLAAFLDECVHPDDADAVREALSRSQAADDSLTLSCRIHRLNDQRLRWVEVVARVDRLPDGTAHRLVGVVADITDRTVAEEHRKLLINELNHRVKNILAVVQGLARQTFKHERQRSTAVSAFEGRLETLARAHEELTREDWSGALLCDIARASLTDRTGYKSRIQIAGPPVELSPKQALTAGMCFHELCTNAQKYGALSTEAGSVRLSWAVDPSANRLSMEWIEEGGPAVTPPQSRGFGTTMLERALRSEFDANVEIDFRPNGLYCRIEAPYRAPNTDPAG